MKADDEAPLKGGRTTQGVVRAGETVCRPAGPHSDFVARLLNHLQRSGFDGAPEALGVDEGGRDVLTFIEGDVPDDLGFYNDEALGHAARLIRRFHDLSAELLDANAATAVGIEVICHNDLSPCNFVFRAGVPVAMIDFDACAPGARLYDLGYASWLWLDLGSAELSASRQAKRLTTFLAAYGPLDRMALIAAVMRRQTILIADAQRLGDARMARWAKSCFAWTRKHKEVLSRP